MNQNKIVRGFTLIELIIGISILFIIIGIVYASFLTGIKTYRKQSFNSISAQDIRIAVYMLSSELRCAFISPTDKNSKFIGKNNQIYFDSFTGSKLNTSNYFIDNDPNTPETGLLKKSGRKIEQEEETYKNNTGIELAPSITSMSLRYSDGKSWYDSWNLDMDEKTSNNSKALPDAVEITFVQTENNKIENNYSLIVPIYFNSYNVILP